MIAHLYKKYAERTAAGEDPQAVLDDLSLNRYCCEDGCSSAISI